jgi:HK97 family phage major capsid protein
MTPEERERLMYDRAAGRAQGVEQLMGGKTVTTKDLGDQIVESEGFKRYLKHRLHESDLIEVSTPWAPAPGERQPAFITKANELISSQFGLSVERVGRLPIPEAPLRVRDLFPQLGLTTPNLVYSRVTGMSNQAAGVAELGDKPQSWVESTPVTASAKKTASFAVLSREALDDVEGLRAWITVTLGNMVRDAEDSTTLTDLLAAPIQEQPKGSDSVLDAVRKGITKLAVAWVRSGYRPTAAVFNPEDWQDLELEKYTEDTGGTPKVTNQYLLMPAGMAPQGMAPTVWRIPVVVTPALSQGTAILGDTNQALLAVRDPLSVRFSDQHASLFTSNAVAILAETRVVLAVFSPKAFVKVTGL